MLFHGRQECLPHRGENCGPEGFARFAVVESRRVPTNVASYRPQAEKVMSIRSWQFDALDGIQEAMAYRRTFSAFSEAEPIVEQLDQLVENLFGVGSGGR
jgi:hypothetical protein